MVLLEREVENLETSDIVDEIPSELIDDILIPYSNKGTRYLQTADLVYKDPNLLNGNGSVLVGARGRFEINSSCYIDSTGHFNAPEISMVYNQLAYVMFARAIELGITPIFGLENLGGFKKVQLPSCYVVRNAHEFRKPIDPKFFEGEIRVGKIKKAMGVCFAETSARFYDSNNGLANASVKLALAPAKGMTS